jgi:hypothetical protein
LEAVWKRANGDHFKISPWLDLEESEGNHRTQLIEYPTFGLRFDVVPPEYQPLSNDVQLLTHSVK